MAARRRNVNSYDFLATGPHEGGAAHSDDDDYTSDDSAGMSGPPSKMVTYCLLAVGIALAAGALGVGIATVVRTNDAIDRVDALNARLPTTEPASIVKKLEEFMLGPEFGVANQGNGVSDSAPIVDGPPCRRYEGEGNLDYYTDKQSDAFPQDITSRFTGDGLMGESNAFIKSMMEDYCSLIGGDWCFVQDHVWARNLPFPSSAFSIKDDVLTQVYRKWKARATKLYRLDKSDVWAQKKFECEPEFIWTRETMQDFFRGNDFFDSWKKFDTPELCRDIYKLQRYTGVVGGLIPGTVFGRSGATSRLDKIDLRFPVRNRDDFLRYTALLEATAARVTQYVTSDVLQDTVDYAAARNLLPLDGRWLYNNVASVAPFGISYAVFGPGLCQELGVVATANDVALCTNASLAVSAASAAYRGYAIPFLFNPTLFGEFPSNDYFTSIAGAEQCVKQTVEQELPDDLTSAILYQKVFDKYNRDLPAFVTTSNEFFAREGVPTPTLLDRGSQLFFNPSSPAYLGLTADFCAYTDDPADYPVGRFVSDMLQEQNYLGTRLPTYHYGARLFSTGHTVISSSCPGGLAVSQFGGMSNRIPDSTFIAAPTFSRFLTPSVAMHETVHTVQATLGWYGGFQNFLAATDVTERGAALFTLPSKAHYRAYLESDAVFQGYELEYPELNGFSEHALLEEKLSAVAFNLRYTLAAAVGHGAGAGKTPSQVAADLSNLVFGQGVTFFLGQPYDIAFSQFIRGYGTGAIALTEVRLAFNANAACQEKAQRNAQELRYLSTLYSTHGTRTAYKAMRAFVESGCSELQR